MSRNFDLQEFIAPPYVKKAYKLYKECAPGTFASRCASEIIEPNIEEINKVSGQANDPLYLAYLCEYAFQEAENV